MEIYYEGQTSSISIDLDVVLSLGAIHTPKVLMQSGIGDQAELQRFGIPVIHHLPGVGHNFQDHPLFACIWEYPEPLPPNMGEVVFFWRSKSNMDNPDLQILHVNTPYSSSENAARFGLPVSGWTLLGSGGF